MIRSLNQSWFVFCVFHRNDPRNVGKSSENRVTVANSAAKFSRGRPPGRRFLREPGQPKFDFDAWKMLIHPPQFCVGFAVVITLRFVVRFRAIFFNHQEIWRVTDWRCFFVQKWKPERLVFPAANVTAKFKKFQPAGPFEFEQRLESACLSAEGRFDASCNDDFCDLIFGSPPGHFANPQFSSAGTNPYVFFMSAKNAPSGFRIALDFILSLASAKTSL